MEPRGIVVGQPVQQVKAQRAKELRREMTPAEQRLWGRLRGNRLDGLHFRRQQVIDGLIADFCCHAARLIIEVDGSVHKTTTDYDAERDRVLATRGLRILRFHNSEVENTLERVIDRIRSCTQEMLSPGPPSPERTPPRSGQR